MTSLAILALIIWIVLLAGRGGFWRVHDDSAPLNAPPQRRVAVVIPARDEAATIGAAVRSLKTQAYPAHLRVFVVDDESGDATASLAGEAGATVIKGTALPPGWTGKLWALFQGVNAALPGKPDYLLLTDADIEHAGDSIAALVSRAETQDLDLASFMVLLSCDTLVERWMIPAFIFFFLKLYPPRWIADRNARTAGAAGGCILIRPQALARIGGIAAIRGELIDDCALARAVKRGGAIWMGLTSTSRSLRVYRHFHEVRDIIARTGFSQLGHSTLTLIATVAGMTMVYCAAPAVVFVGPAIPAAIGALTWALMGMAYIPTLRLYGRSPLWSLTLPLIAVLYTAATVESAMRYWAGSGGRWKGRTQDHRR